MNQELIENNYLYVPSFITLEEAGNLAQEFFASEKTFTFDRQCPKSPAVYNFMPCVKTLIKKIPHVSDLVGEDVLPTYTYGRIYQNGEVLNRHRDRPACEISLTVNLYQLGNPWPIWIQKPSGEEVNLYLNAGDAMVYLGCDADHWREQFTGDAYVQVFLHYVLANGQRSHIFFDR